MSSVLDKVNTPADLQALSIDELDNLAAEIRSLIIETVSKTGGHLAANLGVVELTIALLRTFHPPTDKILWDVSHQTYAYKILTGRKARFGTLRQQGGLSGFLRRAESEYDAFGGGHSGTAVSAALGMAAARDRRGTGENIVAVLGDGSLGCGISLEAFNNVATTTNRLVVVLNDNEMSIAANVGATARYLGKLLASPRYNRWKHSVEDAALQLNLGWLRRFYFRLEEALKSVFLRSVLFEEFGLRYIGPIDGHNIRSLLDAFQIAADYQRPILLHVSTQKGKGYPPAEARPDIWHGASSFDIDSGEPAVQKTQPDYSAIFGTTMERLAEKDDRIVAITAAMAGGTGLTGFAARFPRRFFDVGICEEHAVVFAAGLASQEMRPVFAVYSTFAQRIVDPVIHDVCLQGLPVVICLDRAGIVGEDGPTHHGLFDIALFRCIPGLIFAQPKDEAELADLLHSAIEWGKPVIIRYPRGSGPGTHLQEAYRKLEPGQAEVIREGAEVQIWALGNMIPQAVQAADILKKHGINAGVVNARFIRPMDERLLADHAKTARVVVSVEDGVVAGGFGTGIGELLEKSAFSGRLLRFGWPDQFIPHGKSNDLIRQFGLDAESIASAVMESMDDKGTVGHFAGRAGA